MPHIETVDDLVHEIANQLGVYGSCKAAELGKDCDETRLMCCRQGFEMELADRIRKSVHNEDKLRDATLI